MVAASSCTRTVSQRSCTAFLILTGTNCWSENPLATVSAFYMRLTALRNGSEKQDGNGMTDLPPWIFEAWHFILSREFNLPHQPPAG